MKHLANDINDMLLRRRKRANNVLFIGWEKISRTEYCHVCTMATLRISTRSGDYDPGYGY